MQKHMDTIASFIIGLIFGIGLIFAGMTDPSKVIGFLDIAGQWDPSLAFVMLGAVAVSFVAFRIARGRRAFAVGEVLENIQAEQELSRARLDWLTVVTEHNRAQFLLRRAVGADASSSKPKK